MNLLKLVLLSLLASVILCIVLNPECRKLKTDYDYSESSMPFLIPTIAEQCPEYADLDSIPIFIKAQGTDEWFIVKVPVTERIKMRR